MKFYRDKFIWKYYHKIMDNKLTCVYINKSYISFFKNGLYHNHKNAALIYSNADKEFYLNHLYYGYNNTFTKSSWRKFIKLQAFL